MKSFFEKFKEYCIKDTTRMVLLVLILIALYVVVNLWTETRNFAQIDLTKDKLYTLTDQSKNIAKSVDKDMTFYVWGYDENSTIIDLLKQYNAQNEKIKYKLVTADDLDNKEKYNFEDNLPAVIGEAEDGRRSYISNADLYEYDDGFNMVDLTEQKLTNSLYDLANKEKTKVYFLEGKSNYTLSEGLYYLGYYLSNEYYEVDSINMVSDPTIPEDCDVLALIGLSTDLSETEATNICEYIEKGGDMIIAVEPDSTNTNREYPNFQKVLDEYAISLPNKRVHESANNVIAGFNDIVFQADIASNHEITRLLYNYDAMQYTSKPILIGAGIIEMNSEKMLEDNITSTPILMSSSEATAENFVTSETETTDSNFVLGTAIQKMVESGEESRAVIFSTAVSFSDNSIDSSGIPMFMYNGDIALNSFAFSASRGELYSIRKTSKYTYYDPTEQQDRIVKVIIYLVPATIIVIGGFVWIWRRRLK